MLKLDISFLVPFLSKVYVQQRYKSAVYFSLGYGHESWIMVDDKSWMVNRLNHSGDVFRPQR